MIKQHKTFIDLWKLSKKNFLLLSFLLLNQIIASHLWIILRKVSLFVKIGLNLISKTDTKQPLFCEGYKNNHRISNSGQVSDVTKLTVSVESDTLMGGWCSFAPLRYSWNRVLQNRCVFHCRRKDGSVRVRLIGTMILLLNQNTRKLIFQMFLFLNIYLMPKKNTLTKHLW